MRAKDFISKCIAKLALVSVVLSMFLGSLAPLAVNAATITATKDTMTRVKLGNGGTTADASSVTSNHVFTFTLPNAWNSGDIVYVDFGTATNDFLANASGNWAATDFTIDGLLNTSAAAETETIQLGTFAYATTPLWSDITFPACSPDTTANVVVSGILTTTTNIDPVFGFKRCATAGAEGGTSITLTFTTEAATAGQLENPSTAGSQRLNICFDNLGNDTCDDTVYLAVGIATDDQVTTTATVDPSLTFRVGRKTGTFTTNCVAAYTDATDGGTVAFGRLALATIYNSGDAGPTGASPSTIPPLCTLVSTNATGGAAVTVVGNTAGLVSTSGTPDNIASATAAMSTSTENFGLCVVNSGSTSGTTLSSASPFNSTCALASNTNSVGGITTSPQTILSQTSGPSNESYATISMDINITALTDAHDDYTLTMTFIATGTF